MIALLLAAAFGADVEVVVPHGELHPGVPTVVLVAVTDADGAPPTTTPSVIAHRGRVGWQEPAAEGVWRVEVIPGLEDVVLDVETADGVVPRRLTVAPWEPSELELPRWITTGVESSRATFRVSGPVPPPEYLQVVLGEGHVVDVRAADGGLDVDVELEHLNQARFVPVGVRDARRDETPTWGGIRVRARLELNYQTEPDTRLELTVGTRSYGPFLADGQGIVNAWVDQLPGEYQAIAVFTDPLGNFTRSPLPLAHFAQPSLVALPMRARVTGLPEPAVFLRGVHANGQAWSGREPTCRTPESGELPVVRVGAGDWVLPLPSTAQEGDLRVACALGRAATADFRVPVSTERPQRLRLRVWPEELSADFAVAEVQVSLEDSRGERLPLDGLSVTADHGEVQIIGVVDGLVRGEYRGDAAIEAESDTLRAAFTMPAGHGPPTWVFAGHGPVPHAGAMRVHGRVLDADGLPLEAVTVQLSAGGPPVRAETGPDGWATGVVQVPTGTGPIVVRVELDERSASLPVLRGSASHSGPGTPDLLATRTLTITRGRVAEIDVDSPGVLMSGSRTAAHLQITLRDRAGRPITDIAPELEVDAGTLSDLRSGSDGSWIVLYTPPATVEHGVVTLEVHAEGRTTTTPLQLQVPPTRWAPGLGVGVVSNFGVITSPLLTADLDVRTSLLSHSVMVRAGLAWYRASAETTVSGEVVRVQSTWLPLTLGLAVRRDPGRVPRWLGAGAVLALATEQTWFGAERIGGGVSMLPPGFTVFGGLGYRIQGGELYAEARAISMSDPGGEASFQGMVGGLAGVAGYRVPF